MQEGSRLLSRPKFRGTAGIVPDPLAFVLATCSFGQLIGGFAAFVLFSLAFGERGRAFAFSDKVLAYKKVVA